MTTFTCGCTEVGTERCEAHFYLTCHTVRACCEQGTDPECPLIEGECPPCHLARLRSVSLDGRATPTRRRHE